MKKIIGVLGLILTLLCGCVSTGTVSSSEGEPSFYLQEVVQVPTLQGTELYSALYNY